MSIVKTFCQFMVAAIICGSDRAVIGQSLRYLDFGKLVSFLLSNVVVLVDVKVW